VEWRSPFDRALAEFGPPAVFTLDHAGRLGLDEARTRESWCRIGDLGPREACHCLFTDTATGFVQYVFVTASSLYRRHPRASTARYPTAEDAFAVIDALGPIPLVR